MEENHPIPQDITGFQFKLIGEMTVKQFAYVAAGVIIGWIIFILPIFGLLKIILSIVSIATGAAFAFVPISGRPMDVMVTNFFKAIFAPTQYVYQKIGASLWADTKPQNNVQHAPTEAASQNLLKPKGKLEKKESVFFQNVGGYSQDQGNPLPQTIPSHFYATQNQGTQAPMPNFIKSKDEVLSEENILKNAAVLEKELAESREKEKKSMVNEGEFAQAHQKTLELQSQLNEMLTQKEELEKRLIELQKSMNKSNSPVFTASVASAEPLKETQNVKSIPAAMAKSAGLDVPEFPNLLTGIIKDPRGNPVANILVEVKDEEGNAVRAFKTNALGRFASATALNNGKYTITFEDPKGANRFDSVAFETKGEIINPIEVISIDNREELRRSLFTN